MNNMNTMTDLGKFKKKITSFMRSNWIFLILIVAAFILRVINLFDNPQIFVDENLYISRAWSFFRYQSIDIIPLGYDYDHPFLGWIFLSLFIELNPANLYFENLRFVMIIINIIEIGAIYAFLKRKLEKSAALLSLMFLGFSGIYIQITRMVLIDNIATFFLILSLSQYRSGYRRWISATLFGLSILVKYTYLLFVPGLFYLMLIEEKDSGFLGTRSNGFLKTKLWPFLKLLLLPLLIFSIWFIYALLKGELIGSSTEYGLITKIFAQIQRGDVIPFWESNSYFLSSFEYFTSINPLIFIIPLVFTLIITILVRIKTPKSERNRDLVISSMFFVAPYILFLMRGSYTFYFYLIPIFPFSAILISNGYSIIKNWLLFKSSTLPFRDLKKKQNTIFLLDITLMGIIIVGLLFPFQYAVLYQQRNKPLYDMRDYVIDNLPSTAVYATMGHFLPEFQEIGYSKMFLYWRCNSYDPIFNDTILYGDWRNIDYFIIDSITEDILVTAPYIHENHTYQAFIHSELLISYGEYSDKISIFRVNDI